MENDTTSIDHEDIDTVLRETLLESFKQMPLGTVLIPTGLRYKREGNAEKSVAQRELIRELRPQDLPEFDQAMARTG